MTKQERSVIYFLIAMLALGFTVKFYKARQSRVALKIEKTNLQINKVNIDKIIKEKLLVKINTASATDLARLPGIGPGLAQRIIDYRNKNGSFFTKDDLKKVSGIGDKKYELIKDYIVVE